VSDDFLDELYHYFEYRWANSKNSAVETEADMNLMIQLPQSVQVQIYSDFLYKDFMLIYGRYFAKVRDET